MQYDAAVIGGGPAGLSAAVNLRARGKSVLVISNPAEDNPLWKAERVDNHLGMPGLTGQQMLDLDCRATAMYMLGYPAEIRPKASLDLLQMPIQV